MTLDLLRTMTAQTTPRGSGEAVASRSLVHPPTPAPLGRFRILSTYPPTESGLATFTAALRDGTGGTDQDLRGCEIVRIIDHPQGDSGPEELDSRILREVEARQ